MYDSRKTRRDELHVLGTCCCISQYEIGVVRHALRQNQDSHKQPREAKNANLNLCRDGPGSKTPFVHVGLVIRHSEMRYGEA
jgi:hypothetical protein